MDDVTFERVEEIREELSLNEDNSMLCSSESPNSYHLLINPSYKSKPSTLDLLQTILKPFAKRNGIELYPQKHRVIRLPFGEYQQCLDYQYAHLNKWEEQTFWFRKLDDFDLGTVKQQQIGLDLSLPKIDLQPGNVSAEGRELLKYGLQRPSSRHESQFKIIYYLWRNCVPQNETARLIWRWIQKKHNGFSKDVITHPDRVKYEIQKQTTWLYSKYDLSFVYPDSTHNAHHGYITKQDIEDIVDICEGSLPRTRYLFHIIKYAYPRRYRNYLNIHSSKLIKWTSNRTYIKYLDEFKEKGILKRSKSYLVGSLAEKLNTKGFSKSIQLNWKYKSSDDVVMYEGRAIETFESTIRFLYKPEDLKDMLKRAGCSRQNANETKKMIFDNLKA